MQAQHVNQLSSSVLAVLALMEVLGVSLLVYTQPSLLEVGAGEHIFEVSALAVVPTLFVFVSTMDWRKPSGIVRRLTLPAAALAVTFAGLCYYFEHSSGLYR